MARFVIPASRPIYGWHLAPIRTSNGQAYTQHTGTSIYLGDTICARGHADVEQVWNAHDGDYIPAALAERETLVALCKRGPHASLTPLNCLRFGYGPMLSLVELTGEANLGVGCNKIVAQYRRHVAMCRIDELLSECDADISFSEGHYEVNVVIQMLGTNEENARARALNDMDRRLEQEWSYRERLPNVQMLMARLKQIANEILDREFRKALAKDGFPDLPRVGWTPDHRNLLTR